MRRRTHWLAVVLLAALASGCVTEQYTEFRGAVSRGAGPPAVARGVQPLGGHFHLREKDVADAVTGFPLSESNGILFFIHNREKYVRQDFRVSNDAVSAVYFADSAFERDQPWKVFIRLDETARDQLAGVHRLNGEFDVERWKSNIDFRIRLDMRSAGPEPVSVDGLLTIYERGEFRPGQWFAMTLWSLGLVGPSEAKPAK